MRHMTAHQIRTASLLGQTFSDLANAGADGEDADALQVDALIRAARSYLNDLQKGQGHESA